MIPCIERKPDGSAELLVNGEPFTMLAGELHNSSASSLEYLEPILDRLARCHLNTVLAPVSWELLEPHEGEFDFALVDGLIAACRQRGLKLVPLWFGTLKNAISCYTPPWVKTELGRFFRAQEKPGVNSWTVSVFCEEALRCDARAFAALMRRLRELDPTGATVPLVQVENEPGMLNAPRDYCPAAETAFRQPPPAVLGKAQWDDETFMAWHVARFVDAVAAAGQAVHPLPMFTNAWLVKGPGYLPGQYPSGGPVPHMLDVWKHAAPHLAFLAPDIYKPEFREECAAYHRPDNPLAIPETVRTPVAAAQALYAIGRHRALLYSPFGIDALTPDHPLVETYRLLADLQPLLGAHATTAFLQQTDDETFAAELGGYRFRARPRAPLAQCQVPGGVLLVELGPAEYLAVGRNLTITFEPLAAGQRVAELVWLDTGDVRAGRWIAQRRLNGDETAHGTGLLFGEALAAVRFALHSYA